MSQSHYASQKKIVVRINNDKMHITLARLKSIFMHGKSTSKCNSKGLSAWRELSTCTILCEALTKSSLRSAPQSEREWDDDDSLSRFDLY